MYEPAGCYKRNVGSFSPAKLVVTQESEGVAFFALRIGLFCILIRGIFLQSDRTVRRSNKQQCIKRTHLTATNGWSRLKKRQYFLGQKIQINYCYSISTTIPNLSDHVVSLQSQDRHEWKLRLGPLFDTGGREKLAAAPPKNVFVSWQWS